MAFSVNLLISLNSCKASARGSEWGPVALPVFKTGRRPHLCGRAGFDSQALPPAIRSPFGRASARQASEPITREGCRAEAAAARVGGSIIYCAGRSP